MRNPLTMLQDDEDEPTTREAWLVIFAPMIIASVIIAIIAMASACHAVDPSVLTTGDAGPSACVRLRSLGCPEGSPSKKGETCEALLQAVPDAVNASCVAAASDLASVRTCGVECVQ